MEFIFPEIGIMEFSKMENSMDYGKTVYLKTDHFMELG
jgi:hypothetical protein